MAIDVAGLTARSPFLGSLPHADLEAVVAIGHGARRLSGRQVLGHHEDAAVVLLDGRAITWARSATGTEYLRRIHDPGEALGLATVLGSRKDLTEVVSHVDAEVLWLPGSRLRRLAAERPPVTRACLRSILSELEFARREEALLAEAGTAERVVLRILELTERWGHPTDDGIHLDEHLTQEELASWARCSRESTAKVLHTLRDAGIVATGRRELVVLDLERLRARTHNARSDLAIRSLLEPIG
jgi:CRP/FNR family transcriptional regulator, cyclic AMP receptor protein